MLANLRSGSCSKGYFDIAAPGRKTKVEEPLISMTGLSALPSIRMRIKMENMKTILAMISLVTIFATVPAAIAEQSPGLMNVDISNVANHIARNINVDVRQIPATVQVRVDLAAEVCKVPANVLADRHKNGIGNCTAEITSAELDQTVHRQVKGITR